jgi:hypothetical protein
MDDVKDDVGDLFTRQAEKMPIGYDRRLAQRLIVGPDSVARRDLIEGKAAIFAKSAAPSPAWALAVVPKVSEEDLILLFVI